MVLAPIRSDQRLASVSVESLFLLIIHCRPSTNSEVEVTQSILMWVFSQLSIAIETFNRGLTSSSQDPALFFILNLNKEIQPTR